MSSITLLPEAGDELAAAAIGYESEVEGLGKAFIAAILMTVDHIIAMPMAGDRVCGQIRRRLVRRFPYSILYRLDNDELINA